MPRLTDIDSERTISRHILRFIFFQEEHSLEPEA
jgi:hypothetical protein